MTFLPYQLAWINDPSRLCLAEKSVRIGWTFADAFKNVLKRLEHPRRDYLFASKDYATALEYLRHCRQFCELLNAARSLVSQGVQTRRCPVFRHDRPTAFTQEIKLGYLKFDNGSRILAFSSNPNALRAFGGDVGLDEFAFHPSQEELYATASSRVTWGFDLAIWSSHNGADTFFHQLIQSTASNPNLNRNPNPAPRPSSLDSPWSLHRITLPQAIAQGLAEKINSGGRGRFSRSAFLTDCRARARLPEIFQQEFLCNPCGSTQIAIPWSALQLCQRDYPIERLDLDPDAIQKLFGPFHPDSAANRARRIEAHLLQSFPDLFEKSGSYFLGFDVAASGQGSLSAIYIDRLDGSRVELAALLTARTDDWHCLKTILFTILRRRKNLRACGDETGLGRQICWEAARQFPSTFTAVNFSAEKSRLGFNLLNLLSSGEKIIPAAHPDLAADFFALRKHYAGGRWIFTETPNPQNAHSHCDLAWAAALASHARATKPKIVQAWVCYG